MKKEDAQHTMNRLGSERIPFLFVLDYNLADCYVVPLQDVNEDDVIYDFSGKSNVIADFQIPQKFTFTKHPIEFEKYKEKFEVVIRNIQYGNSYLTNLTQPTKVNTSLSLKELFYAGKAKYKLFFRNRFVVFSPEPFVRISEGKIYSFPMKGTIDAEIENASEILKNDFKEKAEHNTIVDLIRNDLSMVAENVTVKQFQYIEKIETNCKTLLQMSSEICGDLPDDYLNHLGDILFRLLPAGSITGAPKEKTCEIINEAEGYDRGFFTGVCGLFDGRELESAVMIRFFENTPDGMICKSGGGITCFSNAEKEYQEMVDKVYVPV
ncbi:Isochorismate synthase MenF [bioreactor metagenome]|uniref:Isochorismate synthase MenF n=1 Tax=bioreactor metagenome TaxID=1076179 RepID=A0A644WCH2_9ZZZZ